MLGTNIAEGSTGGAPTSVEPVEPVDNVADRVLEAAEEPSPLEVCHGQEAPAMDEMPVDPTKLEPAEPEPEEANDEETRMHFPSPPAEHHQDYLLAELLERLATVELEAAERRVAHAHLAEDLAAFQSKAGDVFTSLYRGQELMMRSINERKTATPRFVKELTGPELSARSGVASPAPPMPPPLLLPLPPFQFDVETFSPPSARLVSVAPPSAPLVAPPAGSSAAGLESCVSKLESELREDIAQLEASLQEIFRRDVADLRESLTQQCVEEVAGGCEEILQRCCEEAVLRMESCWGSRSQTRGLQRVAEELEDESGELSDGMPTCPQEQVSIEMCDLQSHGEALSREMLTLRMEVGELRASADKNEKLYARHVARGERDLAGIRGDFQAWSATAGMELDMVRDEINRLTAALPSPEVLAAAAAAGSGLCREARDIADVDFTEERSAVSTPRSARAPACMLPGVLRRSAEPRIGSPGTGGSREASAAGLSAEPCARLCREPSGGAAGGDRSLAELAKAVAVAAGARVVSVGGFGPRACESRMPAMCAICAPADRMDTSEFAVLSSRDPWREAESELCTVSPKPVLSRIGTPRSPTGDRFWTL